MLNEWIILESPCMPPLRLSFNFVGSDNNTSTSPAAAEWLGTEQSTLTSHKVARQRPPPPLPKPKSFDCPRTGQKPRKENLPVVCPKPLAKLYRIDKTNSSPPSLPRRDSSLPLSTPQEKKLQSQPLTLRQLAQTYSSQLPLQVKVLCGYVGPSPELSIPPGAVYNVHFKKSGNTVAIRDRTGHTYNVPLSSSVRFGLIQSQENEKVNMASTTEFPTFPEVSNILVLRTSQLPKLVCATKAFPGPDKSSSLHRNELLVVVRAHTSRLLGKRRLEVLSLTTRAKKFLPPNCKGHFSTNPLDTLVHLPEIVEYIPDLFPCNAVVSLGNQFTSPTRQVSNALNSGEVNLLGLQKETSLIATAMTNKVPLLGGSVACIVKDESPLLSIPLNDDSLSGISLEIVDEKQSEELHQRTHYLLENFNPSNLKSYKDTKSKQTYETQSMLYKNHREGYEMYGVQLECPLAKSNPRSSFGPTTSQKHPQPLPSLLEDTERHSSHEDLSSSESEDSEGYTEVTIHSTLKELEQRPIPSAKPASIADNKKKGNSRSPPVSHKKPSPVPPPKPPKQPLHKPLKSEKTSGTAKESATSRRPFKGDKMSVRPPVPPPNSTPSTKRDKMLVRPPVPPPNSTPSTKRDKMSVRPPVPPPNSPPPTVEHTLPSLNSLTTNSLPTNAVEPIECYAESPFLATTGISFPVPNTEDDNDYDYTKPWSILGRLPDCKETVDKDAILTELRELRATLEHFSQRVELLESHVYDNPLPTRNHSKQTSVEFHSQEKKNRAYLKTFDTDKVGTVTWQVVVTVGRYCTCEYAIKRSQVAKHYKAEICRHSVR